MPLSSILKTALIGAAIGLTASAAFCSPVAVLGPTKTLLEHAATIGVKVRVDPPGGACEPGLMGFMTRQKDLVICHRNHAMIDGNPDLSTAELVELADTVKHELIHAAQYCAADGNNLFPQYKEDFLDRAQDLGMPMLAYESEDWYSEAEARVLSYLLSEEEVKQLLSQTCASSGQ